MFVRNAWYAAGFWDGFDENGFLSLTMLDQPVVIYRKGDGSLVALEDRCVHRRAALHQGRREGDNLRCMYHGILFSPEGKALAIPGQSTIPARACVRTFPVAERSGWIWVWMGDPARADETLIPPLHGLRNPDWRQPKNVLDYEASYTLLNDNLTDLSHLSFVHISSFGADESWAELPVNVSALERGVRATRWIPDTAPIPPLGKAAAYARTDMWFVVDYLVPGVFILTGETYPVGTAERFRYEEPTGCEPLFKHYSQQVVTPTGPKTCRYFYAWGPKSDCSTQQDAEIMGQTLQKAFLEDKRVIEQQQKIIDLDPHHPVMLISADKGVTMFQRLMSGLMKAEQELSLAS